ncbi:N-acetyl-gamma-glutamyl-phosphate reductase [Metabacillus arenae]|uniref:N-acetyl-gamma-glutamyl-phosphate reductase n=1 Tax=Metabacillus arenae TaxID=2771434 RepID=A0A926RZS4_9BACI|nr:N-acetyl-gamma-glutamyl-phosphate reductase [Metabacillus arenae]MBD1383446.1 N-acetyl-gamma-glutamyl-phosphate reductase [Metabacillus arenae]
MRVGIVGSTGYGGVEIYRLLSKHKYVEECIIYSSSESGKLYEESYPHLTGSHTHLKSIDVDQIENDVDVLFLATPPGVSTKLSPQFIERSVKVIDLSGDLRLKSSHTYKNWYKREAAPADLLNEAVYGLCEVNHDQIQSAKFIANPGCFPTATLLGLAPLTKAKAYKEDSIIVDAKTGVSGAGRKASLATHFGEINENLKIYKVNEHQHIPEIEQSLTEWNQDVAPITFSTHLIPMTRGIMSTIYVTLKKESQINSLKEMYEAYYEKSPFVRIRPIGSYPATKEVFGSNYCDIGLAYDDRTGRVTIVSVIDNLLKGAAGQAVQNFNIQNGYEEITGLDSYPVYP